MPMFSGEELTSFLEQATWAAFNDYEAQLMQERTGKSQQAMADMLDAMIVTKGGKGSVIYHKNQIIEIPTAKTSSVSDPTGCGDAFRAGLLYGLMNDMDWDTTGRIASLMGAIKIEQPGTQNHSFSKDEFDSRFQASFGRSL
jgi:adenosine kinase